MSAQLLIAVAAFFVFGLGQSWARYRIRVLLVQRHPKIWTDVSVRKWPMGLIGWPLLGKDHQDVDDPELTRMVWVLRLLSLLSFAAFVIALLLVDNRGI